MPRNTSNLGVRWIVIGRVETGAYVATASAGYLGGLKIHWRGGLKIFQPWQFLWWPELLAIVEIRLGMARLHLLAVACRPLHQPYGKYLELRCQVRRVRSKLLREAALSCWKRQTLLTWPTV